MCKCYKTILNLAIYYFLLIYIQASHAALINNLYDIELPVSDKTVVERNTVFANAFDKLLLRLIDHPEDLDLTEINKAKNNIDKYITSFKYKNTDNDELLLHTTFNEASLRELLCSINKPYLGKNRPVTVIWLVVDNTKGPIVVGSSADEEIAARIENLAAEQALPIVLPLFDLADQSKVRVKDIVAVASDVLKTASKRYNADIILVGRISKHFNSWQGKWNLLGDATVTWDTEGQTINEQLLKSMNELKSNLIQYYSSIPASTSDINEIRIKISDINSLERYAKVLSYLSNLSIVDQVTVKNVNEGYVIFNLYTSANVVAVQKAISLDRVLKLEPDDIMSEFIDLHYKIRI